MVNKKSFLGGMIALLLVLLSLFAIFVSAEETAPDAYWKVVKYENIADYRNAPEEKDGYLFAGWFTDETCAKAIAKDYKSGLAYAKYVPEEVLGLQAQVKTHLINNDFTDDGSSAIRFLTSVDSLDYSKVGFKIEIAGETYTYDSNYVYKTVSVEIGEIGGEKKEVDATLFHASSQYFKTFTYTNISDKYYDTDLKVTPFWITLDGTEVLANQGIKRVNMGRSWKYVFVDTAGSDDVGAGSGTLDRPYRTINRALDQVKAYSEAATNTTIYVKNSLAVTTNDWAEHGLDVTITSYAAETGQKTIDFSAMGGYNINDAVTFSNVNITWPGAGDNPRVLANGHKLVVSEDVTTNNECNQILGGGGGIVTVESTDLRLYAGTYKTIYGGVANGPVTGDTNIIIGSKVNSGIDTSSHSHTYQLYGAGWRGTVHGNTNITVEDGAKFNYIFGGGQDAATVQGSTNIDFAGDAYAVYGGSYSGANADTHVKIREGADVYQVFGGSEKASMTGDTDIQILGGTIHRRVYGGCYNEVTATGTWNSTYHVTGNTNVTVLAESNPFAFDASDAERALYAISRIGSPNAEEKGAFIFNETAYNNTYKDSIGLNGSDKVLTYFPSQTSHYLVLTNGNTATNSLGTVLAAGNCIHIEPASGTNAKVTIDGSVVHCTGGESYYPLPSETTTTPIQIKVEFTTEAVELTNWEAKIGTAYYATAEEAEIAIEKCESGKLELNPNFTEFAISNIIIKESVHGAVRTEKRCYRQGETATLTLASDDNYYYNSLKVDGKEVILDWDAMTYTFETSKEEHIIEASFEEATFIANANWNLINQNVGLVKSSATNSWLVTEDTYSVATLKWQNQGAVNTGNRANYASYVRYYFTDTTFIDIQILEWNGEYYLKSASESSIYGENVEYWSTLEVSDIGQKIEGEGVELKIVQDGTKIMFYIDGVRLEMKGSFQEGASYIDLTKDANLNDNNKGIDSNSKAIIRFYNDYAANGERVHEFSVSNNVPSGVTFDVAEKENGTVVCNPEACLLGDEATIEVTPNEGYYCSGLLVDGVEVIDNTTENIDGVWIYRFATTNNRHTVEPVYSEKKVSLDIETDGNGTITYTDAYVGEQITLTVTGKNGYNYEQVLVDGVDITSQIGWDGTYTFTASKFIHEVEASFKKGPWATSNTDWNLSKQNLNVLKTTYTGGSSTWLDAAGDYSEVEITVKDYSKGTGKFQTYVLFQFTVDGKIHTAGLRMYYENGDYKIGGTGDNHVFKWAYLRKITEQAIKDKIQGDGVKFKLVREGTMIRVYLDGVYQSTNDTRWDLTQYYGTTTATGITANTPTTRVTVVQCGNGGYDVEIPYKLTKVATIANNADERNGTVTLDKTSCNVGEQVTMTVNPNSGYYHNLKVNGEPVTIDANNNYTFIAQETNTITGTFETGLFQNNANINLKNQHSGQLVLPSAVADSQWLFGQVTDCTEITAKVKYTGDSTGTSGSIFRFVENFYDSTTGYNISISITNADLKGWKLQSMGDSTVTTEKPYTWTNYHYLTNEEVALFTGEGIEFKLVREGVYFHVYLEDNLITTVDCGNIFTAEQALTPNLRIYNNVAGMEIPFSLTSRSSELQSKIAGKNISFIGDSISTFKGYTNDVNRNSTTGWNAVYYPVTNVLTDVNDTWWMRTTNKAGLNLLVNNAWSGDKLVSRGLYRSTQLHNNAGVNPDIIAVYFGINDFDTGISVENFRKYYKRMVANMATRYPDADIFLMNYVPNKCNDRPVEDMLAYNQIVADMAEQYGGTVVDLYNRSGITQANCANYMHDGIALHPNKLGMAAMSEVLLDTMYNKYVK